MSPAGKKNIFQRDMASLSQEQEAFSKLLGNFDYNFDRGGVVKGTIIAEEGGGYLVDVGAKMPAFLPKREVSSTETDPGVEIDKKYEFFILREENGDGQITLSQRRVATAQNWTKLKELMDAEEIVQGEVISLVKGGLLVEVIGLRGFVPSSHVRSRQPMEELIGQTLPFKILSVDQVKNNIILSHRKVVSDQMAEQRRELFSNIEQGAIIEGEVVRLTDFGAFIDLGGVDGLLPLSQMSWRWVEHPTDIMKVGEKVKVQIIGIDPERQRVSLSVKTLHADPWTEVEQHMKQGDQVEGTVTRVKHFGAFVEVYPGVEALLPIRDVSMYEAQQGGQKLQGGEKISTYIIKFSPEERRISLGVQPGGSFGGDAPPQPAFSHGESDG